MNDTAENRLKYTLFVVEATSFETQMLWEKWCKDSPEKPIRNRHATQKWEQKHGWLVTIGKIGKRPVCLSMTWNVIDGQWIMFYDQCSQVTDSVQTEKWLDIHFQGRWDNGTSRAITDAPNFHLCVEAINEANAKIIKKLAS